MAALEKMLEDVVVVLAVTLAATSLAHAQDLKEFNSNGLPRSQGIIVRMSHPAQWRMVPVDDPMALAELRGPHGSLTATLQIARGRQRNDMEALCKPERARRMLQHLAGGEQDTRVTDVQARARQGRPAYEIRYERNNAPTFTVVRSVLVCLKDSQLLVSCAGAGKAKAAVAGIEPVCSRVLESLDVTEG